MKKVLLAVLVTVGLMSCGSNASTEATNDSTAVAVDSVAVDTTAAPAADTSVVK
jgi:uncharacterized protein YcfL